MKYTILLVFCIIELLNLQYTDGFAWIYVLFEKIFRSAY